MTEADLKGALVKRIRESLRHLILIRLEDLFTHGNPDILIIGNGRTSFWEVKHATPKFKTKGIQKQTLIDLKIALTAPLSSPYPDGGDVNYIVYWEKNGMKMTYIVDPKHIDDPIETWDNFAEGFNHTWLVEQIRRVHYVNYNR